jgi:hypothetical protein
MALAYWLGAEQGFGTTLPERNLLRVFWSNLEPKSWGRIEVDDVSAE